ncbi:hypothetical protein C8J57DRAFT_1627389 [Mycena rebaudengoi]|nr:hypothetical protein C8J57DRAFT_1627389 [Mycena rebaudengoi]
MHFLTIISLFAGIVTVAVSAAPSALVPRAPVLLGEVCTDINFKGSCITFVAAGLDSMRPSSARAERQIWKEGKQRQHQSKYKQDDHPANGLGRLVASFGDRRCPRHFRGLTSPKNIENMPKSVPKHYQGHRNYGDKQAFLEELQVHFRSSK